MDCPIENRYPSRRFPDAAVAQWIEYWPPKPRVVGSIPASRTINALGFAAHQIDQPNNFRRAPK